MACGWVGWAIAHPAFGRIEGTARYWRLTTLLLAHPILDSQLRPWHALIIKIIVFQMKEKFFSLSVYQTFWFLVTLLALNHLFPCCISLENSVVGKRRSYLLSTDFTYVSQYGFRFFMILNFFSFVRVVPWNSSHGITRLQKILLKNVDLKINQIWIRKDYDPTVYISVCRVIKLFWILLFWRTIFKKTWICFRKSQV